MIIATMNHPENTTHVLVLGTGRLSKGGSQAYRGTYRSRPDYQEKFGPDHEVNRAFAQFCQQGGQSLVLSDLGFARRLVKVYRELEPPQVFDLVESVTAGETPQFSDNLLGYDISNRGVGFSMLCWGLELTQYLSNSDPILLGIQPLVRLVEEHFKRRLNGHGLFDDSETARFCLECLTSLKGVVPTLWTSDSMSDYKVTGLYLIPVSVD